jgi:uncharacterized protein with PIN domain/sulfur carrier protein ThiS
MGYFQRHHACFVSGLLLRETGRGPQVNLTILFHGNLKGLLRGRPAGDGLVDHVLDRRASIKDVIESLGVPHPEIERLSVNGRPVSFDHIVEEGERAEVFPLTPPVDFSVPGVLRPAPLAEIRFAVDVNVGRLARLLRMAGFDTAYDRSLTDGDLAAISQCENRILLTRDADLLKRKQVVFGHLVREISPHRQLAEVIRLFGLEGRLEPFTRCMPCNGLLASVPKEEIEGRLEPLTRRYYDSFHRCTGCGRIYWPGSHKERMLTLLQGYAKARSP